MIYCPDCGAENEDEAQFCIKCGAPLKEGVQPAYRRYRDEKPEKYEKQEKAEKSEKDEKHEADSRRWGLLVGLLLILAGAISIAEDWWGYMWDDLWPLLIIVLGLFIVWNGLEARRRSPRP